jgi:hypothetical protein
MTVSMAGTSSPNTNKDEKAIKVAIHRRRKGSLMDFFLMKNEDIQEKFMGLPGAQKVGTGDESFVYVPATREDAVLLVAHSDTVWKDQPIKVGYWNGVYGSLYDKVGIGADDRAGITMLWKLRKTGHALLIPNGEEGGLKGSRFLMRHEEWRKKVNSHRFAIEMDRMNASDLAFYGVGSDPFKDWCESKFPGYKRVHGSSTDICALCDEDLHKEDCLDGVNISIGYYGQHSDMEHLKDGEWQRTLSHLHNVLTQRDIPSFKHKYVPYTPPTYQRSMQHRSEIPITSRIYDVRNHHPSCNDDRPSRGVTDSVLVCPKCEAIMDESEWSQNKECCMYCGESF